MAGYIGSKSSVTLVDGYTEAEADAEFVTKAGDSMTGNLSLGDNNKAIFGAGSDLQIYHDGSHSYIAEGGSATGSLRIRGENLLLEDNSGKDYLNAVADAQVELSHNGVKKFETTSTGIAVTQSGTDVGLLVTGGSYNFQAKFESTDAEANIIIEDSNSTNNANMIGVATNDMYFVTNNSEQLRIDATGAVTMPSQPAFLVKPTTSSQQLNIAVNQAVNIVFGTEVFDQNADFSSSAFTAPVTGKYFFSVGIGIQNLDSAALFYEIYIRASNRTLGFTIDPDFGQDAAYWQFNNSGLIDMDAGDTCDIQIYQGAGSPQTDIRTVSFFSGHLVA